MHASFRACVRVCVCVPARVRACVDACNLTGKRLSRMLVERVLGEMRENLHATVDSEGGHTKFD